MTVKYVKDENADFILIWEPAPFVPPEFRLYYDDKGKVVSYVGDKSGHIDGGNYIVIDAQTFAESRYDIKIIEGKISTATADAVVYKLMPSDTGISCHEEDVSIVVDESFADQTKWKLTIYELG
jgi:hypothetical protein